MTALLRVAASVVATLGAILLIPAPAAAQGAAPAAPAQPARPALRAGALTGALRLDGVLDEPAWAAVDSIAALTEIEPVEGGTPAGRTVVRVLASGAALVIGIRADDPEPSRIVSFSRQRDAWLGDQDHVRIVLDTYLDGRSGYVFAVNPTGARYDALVTDQGEGENEDWDTIWEAATVRTETGWGAEIRLPAKSLLFRRGLTTWGLNVQRRVERLQRTDRWASPERDYEVTQTARAGLLSGLPRFELGLGLSVRPSVTAGAGVPAPGEPLRDDGDVSLDVTQRLGANTLASLTVNTDFAETEVDERRTNLTRFPIFFPEKRTFFLEGSDIFDFGLGLNEDVRPFFSRRVGLLAGREVPIEVGGKVNGRLGGTNFGALAVRTGRVAGLAPAATMAVVRVRQNVLRESSVGMIATAGDPLGLGGSRLGGVDLTYQTSRFRGDKNFLVGVWGLATDREQLAGSRTAAGFKIDYPNDLWDVALTHKAIGDAFQPSLGFVPRPGVRISTLSVDYRPRPAWRWVRQMFYDLSATHVTDLGGRWESYRVFASPLNWQLESGDGFELNVVREGERLTSPFEIADGVAIPAGTYQGTRYGLEGELASKRTVSGEASWWFGDFYDGTLHQIELGAEWKPSALLNLELSAERNAGRLRAGRFTQDLVGARVRLSVSPDLQLNSLVQYDNDSESFGTNTRLRWTFHPLGDLFLVYNHNVRTLHPLTRQRQWVFESNRVAVKVQYTLRY